MKNWINTLIEEKGLNIHTTIDVEGKSGLNIIPLGVVVEHILIAPQHEQNQIKNTLVKIDFHSANLKIKTAYRRPMCENYFDLLKHFVIDCLFVVVVLVQMLKLRNNASIRYHLCSFVV